MSDEFKPLHQFKAKSDFNSWSIDSPISPMKRNQQQQHQEIEDIKKQAFEVGYQEGIQKAHSENQQYIQQLSLVVDVLHNPYNLIDKEVEEQLLQTLLWLCKECIKIELSFNPEKIRAIITEMKPYLSKIYSKKRLYLNPNSVDIIKQCLKNEELDIADVIIEDETLNIGEYRLKTDSSELDGRFDTRLSAIIEQRLLDNS